jgi:hypothetical protein
LVLIVFVALLVARLVGVVFVQAPSFGQWFLATLLVGLYSALAAVPLGWIARLVLHRPTLGLTGPSVGSLLTRRS